MDIPTVDPYVVIEARRRGFVRYRDTVTGRRWEVRGTCDRRGDCLIGAVIHGEVVRNHAHLAKVTAQYGERPDTYLDVPVTPEFDTCCGVDRFVYTELAPA